MNATESQLYNRAIKVTPRGAQTFSRMRGGVGTLNFPVFASKSEGVHLYTPDGTKYLDLAGANAACPLGFNHAPVVSAVTEELQRGGGTLSLPTPLEVTVSEALVEAVPYADQVRWVRTGSEAVSAAIATARRATGRHKVIVFDGSYHGWHPWTRDDSSRAKIAAGVELLSEGVPFHGDGLADIAAVLVEPPRMEAMTHEYGLWLRSLRDECWNAGTMVIYDDVVFGFRFATGGLQEKSNVAPDLACFSKALGNGFPVACVAGTTSAMADTPVSSTFGGETSGLAAAAAVLAIHATQDVCADLLAIGQSLRTMLDEALNGTPVEVYGTPQHFRFQIRPEYEGTSLDGFLDGCLSERLLVHRASNNVSLAMGDTITLSKIGHAVASAAKEM